MYSSLAVSTSPIVFALAIVKGLRVIAVQSACETRLIAIDVCVKVHCEKSYAISANTVMIEAQDIIGIKQCYYTM